MAGIYGFFSRKHKGIDNIFRYFYSNNFPDIINEEFDIDDFKFGRSVLPVFENDRFIYQDEHLIFAFEGVCYSFSGKLKNQLPALYKTQGIDLIKDLEGQFCGFIFDKLKNKLFIFTDQLSTKPLYLFHDKINEIVFFSSELKSITKSLGSYGISLTPDDDAFRCLLTFGYMLDDLTPAKEVKKIPPGSIITINLADYSMKQHQYFKIEKKVVTENYSNILHEIDKLLIRAIRAEWEKDLQYNLDHFTFLSGGLDSRVNALIGSNLDSIPTYSLTFSVQNTRDHIIADQIARDSNFKHTFWDFKNGDFLADNEFEYIKANDGLVAYYGAAHQQHSLQNYNLNGKGLAHSGQIGDVIFGSFTKQKSSVETGLKKLAFNYDSKIINKIKAWNEYVKNEFTGDDLETFSLKQRQINGTLNGDRTCSHLIDLASPFYNKKLIQYCLSIPDKYKFNQAVYLDWMNAYHPEISAYKWASTGALPSTKIKDKATSFSSRLTNYLLRKVGIDKNNMNPYNRWYEENKRMYISINKVYSESDLNGLDRELIADIESTFKTNYVIPKMLAVTAILSYRLHFLER